VNVAKKTMASWCVIDGGCGEPSSHVADAAQVSLQGEEGDGDPGSGQPDGPDPMVPSLLPAEASAKLTDDRGAGFAGPAGVFHLRS
jgi:hypothetical protein